MKTFGTSKGWRHWCPKGCGKTVVYYKGGYKSRERKFVCERCGKEFTTKEINRG